MYFMMMMFVIAGDCFAGWYCNHTSEVPDQNICPRGSYCPSGTGVPLTCPAGTFSTNEGNNDLADCVDCTAGMYCQGKVTGCETGWDILRAK